MKNKLEDWKTAGEIVAEVFREISAMIRAKKLVIELCEYIESRIIKKGAKPAFPVNVSINSVAAHYTSPPGDKLKIPDKALVKIDIGVSYNGAIADAAKTFIVGDRKPLFSIIRANERALMSAIEILRDGVKVREISNRIWKISHEEGYGVLTDLGGHEIKRNVLHAGLFIPNSPFNVKENRKIKKGMILAIEPFLVTSAVDSNTTPLYNATYIFSLANKRKIGPEGFLSKIYRKYGTLPFALRWLIRSRNTNTKYVQKIKRILNNLENKGIIVSYPVLVDSHGFWVSQFEHTVLVKEASAEILTQC